MIVPGHHAVRDSRNAWVEDQNITPASLVASLLTLAP